MNTSEAVTSREKTPAEEGQRTTRRLPEGGLYASASRKCKATRAITITTTSVSAGVSTGSLSVTKPPSLPARPRQHRPHTHTHVTHSSKHTRQRWLPPQKKNPQKVIQGVSARQRPPQVDGRIIKMRNKDFFLKNLRECLTVDLVLKCFHIVIATCKKNKFTEEQNVGSSIKK